MHRNALATLRCPQCAAALEWPQEAEHVVCTACPLSYPVHDGIPVLVIGEARARRRATDPEFEQLLAEAVAAPFAGWEWSWLDGRRTTQVEGSGDLSDLYDARARALVAQSTAILDLGTGGGERLARCAPFPTLAMATEAYVPNVLIAAERLGPLGVQLIRTDHGCHNSVGPRPGNRWPERRLPFADETFDLVLASRTAFSPLEVARA